MKNVKKNIRRVIVFLYVVMLMGAQVTPIKAQTYEENLVSMKRVKSDINTINVSDSNSELMNGARSSKGKYSFDVNTGIISIYSGSLTLTGNTLSRKITVYNQVTVTLDNLNIDVSAYESSTAFLLQNGADVTLILKGDNVLKSGNYSAGIQVRDGTRLSINAEDQTQKLTAVGGYGGAGIGGGSGRAVNSGTINILGGSITAQGGEQASGIGGGGISTSIGGNGGTIEISGGLVNVTGGTGGGAGIGGGWASSGGTIKISGGIVNTTGGSNGSAGIGGGGDGNLGVGGNAGNITISGGKVTAVGGTYGGPGIGSGRNSYGGNVSIQGGTIIASRNGTTGDDIGSGRNQYAATKVKITGGNVSASNVVISQPTNGLVPIYLNILTIGNPHVGNDKAVTEIYYDTLLYGSKDVVTTHDGKIHVWLPQNNNPSANVNLELDNGGQYSAVWKRNRDSDNRTLLKNGDAETPTLSRHPESLVIGKGQEAILHSSAFIADEGILSYQWYRDGQLIPNATDAIYDAVDTSVVGKSEYYVIVTNSNSSLSGNTVAAIQSDSAEVTVADKPTIGILETPSAIYVGESLNLEEPTITDNYSEISSQGWRIGNDETGWNLFDPATPLTDADHGKFIYYYAVNHYGQNYSNRVQIEVLKYDALLSVVVSDIIYGETIIPQVINNTSGGVVSYEYKEKDALDSDYNAMIPTEAGEYTIRATVSETESYKTSSVIVNFEIRKATPTVQDNPTVEGAVVGRQLETLGLDDIIVYGADNQPIEGVWKWKDAKRIIESSEPYTAVFTPANDSYDPITLNVSVKLDRTAPSISSIKVTPSLNDAKLEVIAASEMPLFYQWQVKGSWIDIPGATMPSFSYTDLMPDTKYTIRVKVTDVNGNVTISDEISFRTESKKQEQLPLTGVESKMMTPLSIIAMGVIVLICTKKRRYSGH